MRRIFLLLCLATLTTGLLAPVAGAQPPTLDDPVLGGRQRLQRLHPGKPHAVGVAADVIRTHFERGRPGQGLGRARDDGNGLGEGRRRGEKAEQRPQRLAAKQPG